MRSIVTIMNTAAININFDSLSEAYRFPGDFRDPCYSEVAERFFGIARKFNFKYSIFVIGKDLENEPYREALREWARQGHEIGNHSFSHRMDLGALPYEKLREEVQRSHELIFDATGVEPRGFISPAWSWSRRLLDVLYELNYDYDTSSFPSWLLYFLVARVSLSHFGNPQALRILRRKDYLRCLVFSRRPHLHEPTVTMDGKSPLVILPLPANHLRIACWHTVGFMLGWRFHDWLLDSCLRQLKYFYYLVHPADLLDPKELSDSHRQHLSRSRVPLERKMWLFEKRIEKISQERRLVTVGEMARSIREEHSKDSPS